MRLITKVAPVPRAASLRIFELANFPADGVTTYFDRHWKRVNGKIPFDPSQSLETDRRAVNPAPDIAGLYAVPPSRGKLYRLWRRKFRWFWAKGHDGEPDLDNGGAGMSILQLMLMQMRQHNPSVFRPGRRIRDVDFKLHAPQNTTIEGNYSNEHLRGLRVFPESRAKDIVQMTPQ